MGGMNSPTGHRDSGSGESTLYGDGGSSGIDCAEIKKKINVNREMSKQYSQYRLL